jgi:ribosomal protein L37AE/L43A
MDKISETNNAADSCPYCGSKNREPYDFDSWFCMDCKRDYPTEA